MTLRLPLHLLTVICQPYGIQNARGAGKSEKGITLRLLACEVTKEPAKVVLQTKDSKSAALDLPSSGFSEPIAVSARSVKLKTPDNDAPLCSITLPADGKSFAVVLASEKPAGFVPFVVRLDDDSFKAGDYYLINRSAKTVVLKLGGTEVILEAGNAVKSRPTDPVHEHHYNITLSDRSDSGDKVIGATRWPVANINRSYVIFLTGHNGKTTYRSVDQSVLESAGSKKKR
ncbi:hypothetical protein HQ447_12335 [bacterium]|nr:hypothetical protein [bacterium]